MLQYDEEIGRLYSCCDDKKVICWDVAQLRQVKVFDGHKDKVYREVRCSWLKSCGALGGLTDEL
jgi:WD40 repeat protein